MTQTKSQMATLYDRLSKIGFPKSFVREKALPDWWDEELDEAPEAFVEAATYVSRRLNLDVTSLLTAEPQLAFAVTSNPKFKMLQGTDGQQMKIAYALASRIAELVAFACTIPYQPIAQSSAMEIRTKILQTRESIDLQGFLEFCWNQGIPVVHFDEFPQGIRKFHGVVGYFHDRPVIVVSLNANSPARLLFIAAHELGHIFNHHVVNQELLVDEKVELESLDDEEFEANEFAGELLLGKADMSYYTPYNYKGEKLAAYARRIGNRDRVDSGVVALNYGWYKKHWGAAQEALKLLEPNANAPQQINTYLKQQLDWERLSEDNQDYLAMMLGVEGEVGV